MMDDGQGGPLRKVFEGGATSYKALKLRPASNYRVAVQVHLLFYFFVLKCVVISLFEDLNEFQNSLSL